MPAGAPGGLGSRPSAAEFERQLHEALTHAYEPERLRTHPLQRVLTEVLPRAGDEAKNLRDFLFDAIDGLDPGDRAGTGEKARRPYQVLFYRYVAGYTMEAIGERLHISARQLRREHHTGMGLLVDRLWPLARGAGEAEAMAHLDEARDGHLRSEVARIGTALENFSLTDLLATAQAPAQALARHVGAGLAVHAQAGDVRCFGDRALARQALLSAVSALLTQRPSHVEVRVGYGQGTPQVEVWPRPAVRAEQLPRLRGELSATGALMAAQGGRQKASLDDAGACVTVRLLFRPERTVRVLAVDDDERMLRLYERYLSAEGHAVATATSAAAAEAMLRQQMPDVIVLDVMMREVDGWELLQRLRGRVELRDVPILVCSVLNEPTMALALGAQAYLRKPVAEDEFLQALRQLLATSSPAAPHPA